ncbi:Pho87 phosphate permease [Candida orthopsilosis Co 90-125]|uniref:Pho87 phosphate permease n=1 Tax=Candida orthopsilosis (strain 90-125) TaxID=1136231 RepID=H8X041_CANO9|nr:Pho87 phosphate permease [Candida orthopsilosis Co 90-125]CCG22553.1 Pho87 phosphate permease [Candida orthopsilosis Co 90-125]
MKFAHSLKFNAVPEWYYLKYSTLKKTIYELQQDQIAYNGNQDQGYIVGKETTTVTELVDHFEANYSPSSKHSSSSGGNDDSIEESSSSDSDAKINSNEGMKNRLAKKLNLLQKLKKNKPFLNSANSSSASDIELNHIDLEQNDKDGKEVGGNGDIHSYSAEVVSLSNDTSSFTNDNDVITHFINDPNESFANPNSLEFDPLHVFTKQLLVELTKINDFYKGIEKDIFDQYNQLNSESEQLRIKHALESEPEIRHTHSSSIEHHHSHDTEHQHADLEKQSVTVQVVHDDSDEEEEEDDKNSNTDSVLLDEAHFNENHKYSVTKKKQCLAMYIRLSELKSYIELNRVGFAKICKKFDKVCGYSITQDFCQYFLPLHSYVFQPHTIETIDTKLDQVVRIYAFSLGKLYSHSTKHDLEPIKNELRSHLRDHIVFERNTVWKDLLSLEKRSYNLDLDENAVQSSKIGEEGNVPNSLMKMKMTEIELPKYLGGKKVSVPAFLLTTQILKIITTAVVFAILMSIKTFNDPVQGRSLAVLVACAMLWASEAIPLHTTAMFVPLLVVTCKICKVSGSDEPMTAPDAASYILGTMWNSTIMILLGGFTLAAALSKYNLAKILSSWILAAAGTKPRNIILANMIISMVLSIFLSNTAAPVIALSLVRPMLKTIPSDHPFTKALILGIAFASNCSGMSSPISSPQNVIALQEMTPDPGWQMLEVSLPTTIVAVFFIWLLLISTFKINTLKLAKISPIREKLTTKQYFVLLVAIITILLWCVIEKIQVNWGSSGIVTCFAYVMFFATGLLTIDDLNNFPWSIIVLAMGGIALGKAIGSSGLLSTIAIALQKRIMDYSAYVILLIFGIIVLVFATFVSHTVAALIIVPLVKEVGDSLPKPHPNLLILGTALIASCAMALPTSGFPNVTAISMRDELGRPYLTVNEFISRGVPASIIAYLCVITIGYGVMSSIGY